jgi:two-component system, OmpR family, sensor kinase
VPAQQQRCSRFPNRTCPRKQPLVHSLNDLLGRLGRAIAVQKGFIADAAHELRTPLTAVQLQLELARWATTPEEREAAFEDLQRGVSRAIHLIGQLLTLARQEPEVGERPLEPTDLSEIARLAVAEQTPLAIARQVDVSDAIKSVIQGDAETLRVMLGNLVDNAIRYSSAGGRVDVAVTHTDHHAFVPSRTQDQAFLSRIANASLTDSFADTSSMFPEAASDSPS